uniref:Solute carrier family 35 member D3 n=1 Tax=Podarcis muralis TaxID=64176 RepID=A0A670I543_PODMU|nr:solute carrier family 35 member D3 [Podarcis muralis]XP_028579366.1 solute carrier family 35 member D3 [Podarcis muralis]
MQLCRGRALGISVAVAHGVFSGSLNILLKFLITRYHFAFLTLLQCLTSSTAALSLEVLRRRGALDMPPFGFSLARLFAGVTLLSTLQSSLTLWSLRGLSLPMYVVFKRCLPLVTLLIGVLVLKNGIPSVGVLVAVLITTCGAALAGAGDLTGDPIGYLTGVLAVLVHAAYLVLIQKTSADSDYGPLTAQYAIAVSATPFLIILSFASMDAINVWSFPGWKDPAMTCTFIVCVVIGCAMNFTTLHCTYINSAVTTSFVGVVKSIATITVGMVAFSDVEPTKLFIAGVVVNTIGSIIYCVAKYMETRKQSHYEDLEKEMREEEKKECDGEQPPFVMEEISKDTEHGETPMGESANGSDQQSTEEKDSIVGQGNAPTVTDGGNSEGVTNSSLKDAYLGVWRLVRGANYMKKDYLVENEELPSP